MEKQKIRLTSKLVALGCFMFLSQMQAVTPPPDGCYPNFTTAEGCKALQSLTTGVANTGIGWYSLFGTGSGSYNTAVGAGALDLNNADNNTAVGVAALLLNTTGTNNTANGAGARPPAMTTRPPECKRLLATLVASSTPLRVIERWKATRTALPTRPPGLKHFTTPPTAAATRPMVFKRSYPMTPATTTRPLAFLPWAASLLEAATQAWAVQRAPASLPPITLFVSAITSAVRT